VPAQEPSLEWCAAPSPGKRFCCHCGRLLVSCGDITNQIRGDIYTVIEVMAQGGISNTYLIYHHYIGKLAVLKKIRADLAGRAKARELFERETRFLHRCTTRAFRGFTIFSQANEPNCWLWS
jgi:serine/threonine protein kinase